jgi:dienelactone hydrolase
LLSQPVKLRITGLAPGDTITISAHATDAKGVGWGSQALFKADGQGVVDPAATAPVSGSYQGVDGMGLLWSMNPASGDPDRASFTPELSTATSGFPVDIAVIAHGRRLATTTLTREVRGAGVTERELTQQNDQLSGELFLPATGSGRHPAVLVFGGSEGGVSTDVEVMAAQLASQGYPALALGYFGLSGLPQQLQDIPLEYFATAGRLLAAQPQSDPAHVLTLGISRGSEAALSLAQNYPDLFHGALLYAPSAQVNPGFPNGGTAWTLGGQPLPQGTIPVDRVSGPVLAVAGGADAIWSSADWAHQIDAELTAAHRPDPHQVLVYPGAGHIVVRAPYLPQGTWGTAATGEQLQTGGTRAADAAAREADWPKLLALLAGIGH